MYFRQIALASLITCSIALPAFAQTPDTTTPAPNADSAIPDAGVKKAPAATPAKHRHHVTHLAHKTKTGSPAKAS